MKINFPFERAKKTRLFFCTHTLIGCVSYFLQHTFLSALFLAKNKAKNRKKKSRHCPKATELVSCRLLLCCGVKSAQKALIKLRACCDFLRFYKKLNDFFGVT